jgi:hypothetical protein
MKTKLIREALEKAKAIRLAARPVVYQLRKNKFR